MGLMKFRKILDLIFAFFKILLYPLLGEYSKEIVKMNEDYEAMCATFGNEICTTSNPEIYFYSTDSSQPNLLAQGWVFTYRFNIGSSPSSDGIPFTNSALLELCPRVYGKFSTMVNLVQRAYLCKPFLEVEWASASKIAAMTGGTLSLMEGMACCKNGVIHSESGPAFFLNGRAHFYLDGKPYEIDDWLTQIHKRYPEKEVFFNLDLYLKDDHIWAREIAIEQSKK
jgi:hypothetical protein